MANSGTVYTDQSGIGLRIGFSWSVSNINAEAGTATLNWNAFTSGSNGSAAQINGSNYGNINGSRLFTIDQGSTQGYPNGLGVFDSNGVHTVHDDNWNYYTFYTYTYLGSGSRTVYYNDDGYCSFTIDLVMNVYGGNKSNSHYIQLDRIDRFNKARKTTNSGSSWSQNANFWKTTDYGVTWKKCNGWKTTNSGSTWTKV